MLDDFPATSVLLSANRVGRLVEHDLAEEHAGFAVKDDRADSSANVLAAHLHGRDVDLVDGVDSLSSHC